MAQHPSAPSSSLEPPSLLVAGAGPVGLVAACELRRHGLHVRVVERSRGPSEHSKALALHARTLEILSAHDGVVDALIAAGTIVEGIEFRTDGHLAASLSLTELNGVSSGASQPRHARGTAQEGAEPGGSPPSSGSHGGRHGGEHGLAHREEHSADCGDGSGPSVWATRFPFVLMVPQRDTERILTRCLKDVYGTDVEWQTELVRIRQDSNAVHVQLRHQRASHPPTPATASHTSPKMAGKGKETQGERGRGEGTEVRRELEREARGKLKEGAREGGMWGGTDGGMEEAVFDLVCACDGPHSTCRLQLSLSFDGLQYPMHALLADVALSHWPFPRDKGHVFTRGKHVAAAGAAGGGASGSRWQQVPLEPLQGSNGSAGVLVALPFGVDGLWRLIFDEGTARMFAPAGLLDQTESRRQGNGRAVEGGAGAAAGEERGRGLGAKGGRGHGAGGDGARQPEAGRGSGGGVREEVDEGHEGEIASETPYVEIPSTADFSDSAAPVLRVIPSAPVPTISRGAGPAVLPLPPVARSATVDAGAAATPSPSAQVTARQPILTPQHVSAMVNAVVPCGAHVDTIHWSSVFSMHLRSLNRFLHGRVLFLGDAAHIHSPVGGQGLNTGVQDAYNAAWKVALVGRGIAGWELLTTYDTERRAAVAEVLKATDIGTRTMFLPTFLTSLSRSTAFFLLSHSHSLRVAAAATVAQLSLRYPPSSLLHHDLTSSLSSLSSLLSSPLSAPLRLLPPPLAAALAPAAAAAAPGARAPDAMLLLLLPPSHSAHFTHTAVSHTPPRYSPSHYSHAAVPDSPPRYSGGGGSGSSSGMQSGSSRLEGRGETNHQQQQQQKQQKAQQLQRAMQLQKASQHVGGGGWQACSVHDLLRGESSSGGGGPAHHVLLFAGDGSKQTLLQQLRQLKDEAVAAAAGGRKWAQGEEVAWKIPVSVHCILQARAPVAGIVQACGELIGGLERTHGKEGLASSSGSSSSSSSASPFDTWEHVSMCVDAHGYAYERYHGDACPFYLVRPDGHVAMRADHWQPGRAQAYFDGIRGSCGKAGGG
ncbi:hypothetical protein CLOM_g22987 [Closterium sp. NIES-68]|nr:hypothetical protein CLOM_g22987 [Closterium sp. NIES-68]GJP73383.1 hypothetical protein CLOP_g4103 [Closterium sp. NIES-67]